MRKNVMIVWDDYYHPEANYREAIRKSFEESGRWDVTKTHRMRDLLTAEPVPDLCICITVGCPDGEEMMSIEEQAQVKALVEDGMGILFIHAGLACITEDTPMFEIARGRFASHPEPHYDVYCTVLPGCSHPIVDGIQPFVTADEHYFCKVDIERVTPLLVGISDAGTEIAGWAHTLGEGRVCCLTPGHNHPMMIKLRPIMEHAADWCAKRQGEQ